MSNTRLNGPVCTKNTKETSLLWSTSLKLRLRYNALINIYQCVPNSFYQQNVAISCLSRMGLKKNADLQYI